MAVQVQAADVDRQTGKQDRRLNSNVQQSEMSITWSKQQPAEPTRVLSIQSHVVSGHVGNKVSTVLRQQTTLFLSLLLLSGGHFSVAIVRMGRIRSQYRSALGLRAARETGLDALGCAGIATKHGCVPIEAS